MNLVRWNQSRNRIIGKEHRSDDLGITFIGLGFTKSTGLTESTRFQGIEAGNDKALRFKKPFDVDAVMSGVFESYFYVRDLITG